MGMNTFSYTTDLFQPHGQVTKLTKTNRRLSVAAYRKKQAKRDYGRWLIVNSNPAIVKLPSIWDSFAYYLSWKFATSRQLNSKLKLMIMFTKLR